MYLGRATIQRSSSAKFVILRNRGRLAKSIASYEPCNGYSKAVYLDACLCTGRDGMGTGVQISERSVLMVKSFRGSRVGSCRKSSGVPRGRLWRGGSACGLGTAGVDERGTVDSLSEAQLGAEDASLIKRLLDHGPVTIEFSFSDRIRKDVKAPNVTAEISEGRRRMRWRSWMRTWIHGSRGRARRITEPARPA